MKSMFWILAALSFQVNPSAHATALQCLDDNHQMMGYNNAQVIQWEHSTPDQFHARGMLQGSIIALYPNETGHTHFAMSLGNGAAIEVIYNNEFGALPPLRIGMNVVACGDYITVGPNAQLPSPEPAIIHWVHVNPGTRDGGAHPSGFLFINNQAYGLTE